MAKILIPTALRQFTGQPCERYDANRTLVQYCPYNVKARRYAAESARCFHNRLLLKRNVYVAQPTDYLLILSQDRRPEVSLLCTF